MSGDDTNGPGDEPDLPLAHGRGFVFTMALAVAFGVGASTVGVTWASRHGDGPDKPVVDASPVASTARGSCTLLVDDRVHTMDVDRARTLTMIAGVGTQVGATPQQMARVVDIAMRDAANYLPSVNATLALLARDDPTGPSAINLAEVEALSRPAAMSCVFGPAPTAVQKKGSDGLTPRAQVVRTSVLDAFGKLAMHGSGPMVAGDQQARAAGLALTVEMTSLGHGKRAAGWVLASWLVARASNFGLDRISFDNHRWQPSSGWRTIRSVPALTPSATPVPGGSGTAADPPAPPADVDRLQVIVTKGR